MRRILVAVLSALMIVALSAAPVAANEQVPPHVAGGAFTGTASLTGGDAGGLFYPVSPASCGADLCPGQKKNWSFSGDGVGIHYEPPGGGPFGGVGSFEASVGGGTVSYGTGGYGAYCGYSSGGGGFGDLFLDEVARVDLNSGVAVVPVTGGTLRTQDIYVTSVGWVQSAATLIPFHGTVDKANTDTYQSRTRATVAAHGTIDGVVSAVPTPGAGSCTDGTATEFTIVGAAVAIWHDGAS